jgi:uncharacterized membrane protein YedE/YeeE
MMPLIAALAAGTLFGLGLAIAGMIDPAKVVNFLDIFGTWDPSLAFVMGGGLLVNAIATPFIMRRKTPILAELFRTPTKHQVDKRLIIGGVLFGAGWGIGGYCPGPMLTSLSFANSDIIVVVGAYIVGTFLARTMLRAWERDQQAQAQRDQQSCVE